MYIIFLNLLNGVCDNCVNSRYRGVAAIRSCAFSRTNNSKQTSCPPLASFLHNVTNIFMLIFGPRVSLTGACLTISSYRTPTPTDTDMVPKLSIALIFFGLCCQLSVAYKPVVLIHGILADKGCMNVVAERIKELHPGTVVYATDRFIGWSSLAPMWHQVDALAADLLNISKAHPEGIHLVGYSQGGLVSRAILEKYPEHNVQTFISLSSPQAGQYGTKFLHLYFPNLWLKTAFEIFYSDVGQYTSVANYWNDPHHQNLYYKYSVFLPFANNEKTSDQSEMYKKGFQKLKKLVLIGGPDDEVITPWQSSHFGYYNENETVIDMKERDVYKQDMFGLKTLDESGRIQIITQPGIDHFNWHINLTVIDEHIIPHLD